MCVLKCVSLSAKQLLNFGLLGAGQLSGEIDCEEDVEIAALSLLLLHQHTLALSCLILHTRIQNEAFVLNKLNGVRRHNLINRDEESATIKRSQLHRLAINYILKAGAMMINQVGRALPRKLSITSRHKLNDQVSWLLSWRLVALSLED